MTRWARGTGLVSGLTIALALALGATARGDDQADFFVAFNKATAAYGQANYAEAARQYERAVALADAAFGPNAPNTAGTLSNLGAVYVALGQYERAEPVYQRSLKMREAALVANDPSVADSLNNLAALYNDLGQYAKAEPLFQRSLAIREASLGADDPAVAASLNNLATLYEKIGQFAKAEPLFLRSLKIYEARLGADHPSVADCLNNLAGLYREMRQYDQAEPLYQRSLKIYEAKRGADHPLVATSLNNLGLLYYMMGRYAQAEPFLERSLKIREARLGADHPLVATSQNNLASLYEVTGRYTLAEPLYEHSLKIRQTRLGDDHPDVATTLNNLAVLHAAMGQVDRSRKEFDLARRIVRRHVAAVLPMLAAAEQTAFLNNTDLRHFYYALSLGWTRPADEASTAASAGWLANGKAVAVESLAQRAALGRDSGDPKLQPIARGLIDVRTRLANLVNAQPKPGQEAARLAELGQLGALEQDLSRQLSRAGGTAAPPRWVELDAVRRALTKDALLIDIARFQPSIFGAKDKEDRWQAPHYAAWLTPAAGEGNVRVVDLGEAKKIEAAVEEYQAAMEAAESGKTLRELGEGQAAAELQKPLAKLARLVLDPLKPAIGDKRELILSPDASLWLVPWTALPTGEQDQFAIEKWKIRYVTSARDLAAEHQAASTNPPRVFANPNYDLPPAEMPAVLAAIFGGAVGGLRADDARAEYALADGTRAGGTAAGGKIPGATAADGTRSVPATLRSVGTIGRARLLPGTAEEAKAIMPNLQKYAGQPKLYADRQALEGVFKRLAAPRVLVLSTHGFFLPDQAVKLDDESGAADAGRGKRSLTDATGSAAENPLLRCGLLLAGCNQRERIGDMNLDDGILTGMEIVGTNLRGTELVVLAACETGVGEVQSGEGVAGLRQAFQLAGAQSVVATLWQIPDKETAQLMNDFFSNLADGQSKADALRNAQLAMIKARREKEGAAHPLYWAAFTLTGQ